MYFNVSLGYVRSLASWKPFTVPSKDGLPALSGVHFTTELTEGGIALVAEVTDRYRIVRRSDIIGTKLVSVLTAGDDEANLDLIIPMDLIVQFVAATKTEKYPATIGVKVTTDDYNVTLEGAGSSVTGILIGGRFPKIGSLLETWLINDKPLVVTGFDVNKIADFTKLVSPSDGKKYSGAWRFEQGRSQTEGKSGSYRLSNKDDESLKALLMPLFSGF